MTAIGKRTRVIELIQKDVHFYLHIYIYIYLYTHLYQKFH